MEPLSALCVLFDTVVCFGNVAERNNAKAEELADLTDTIESISASVQAFAQDLLPEERAATFHQNKVFPDLMEAMRKCEEVINKRCTHCEELGIENAQAPSQPQLTNGGNQTMLSIRRGVKEIGATVGNGLRSLCRESLEALEGKWGKKIGQALKLPPDELETIRKSGEKMRSLVPLLNLAISAHTSRGRKRLSVSGASYIELDGRDQKSARLEPQAIANGSHSNASVFLQLVSDAAEAKACTLPVLVAADLRPAVGSSTSLESSNSDLAHPHRRLFGRQEVREKVHSSFMLAQQPGGQKFPVNRFVGRDVFAFEEKLAASSTGYANATLDQATLQLGDSAACGGFDDSETLALGGNDSFVPVTPHYLAAAKSGKNGFHFRTHGDSRWQWVGPESNQDLKAGDCIALILESPPGTCKSAPQRDLEAFEVTCLLGVEFRAEASASFRELHFQREIFG